MSVVATAKSKISQRTQLHSYSEKLFESFEGILLWIVALAAVNWGAYGIFDFNAVTDIIALSSQHQEFVYGGIMIVGIIVAYNLAHEM